MSKISHKLVETTLGCGAIIAVAAAAAVSAAASAAGDATAADATATTAPAPAIAAPFVHLSSLSPLFICPHPCSPPFLSSIHPRSCFICPLTGLPVCITTTCAGLLLFLCARYH